MPSLHSNVYGNIDYTTRRSMGSGNADYSHDFERVRQPIRQPPKLHDAWAYIQNEDGLGTWMAMIGSYEGKVEDFSKGNSFGGNG
jgi:hypothetical protein